MKRFFSLAVIFCLTILVASGCSGSTSAPPTAQQSNPPQATQPHKPVEFDGKEDTSGAVLDLTALSSIMVYSEVYSMLASPEDYIGKNIKVQGKFYSDYSESTGQYYHYVVVEDATACCAQGLEFVWEGDHVYPEDYPAEESIIELTGMYGHYEEKGNPYRCLVTSDIEII